MTPKIYVGVDPGMSGGIAALCNGQMRCTKMPATEHDVWQWFEDVRDWPEYPCMTVQCFAVIERVHSMPKQGVASTFKFGYSYGLLRGMLVASGIPFEDVTPQLWQKGLGITPGRGMKRTDFKNRLKARAQCLFPKEKITLATADALLLAEYCRRKCEGKLGLNAPTGVC